jgi:DNA-binding response OmpR family regulator
VPVIVVSMLDERSRGLASGAAAYLVKPVAREALLSALAAVGVPVRRDESRTEEEVTT